MRTNSEFLQGYAYAKAEQLDQIAEEIGDERLAAHTRILLATLAQAGELDAEGDLFASKYRQTMIEIAEGVLPRLGRWLEQILDAETAPRSNGRDATVQ